jgi:Carboxypeptidase regulatory-like domain
MEFGSSKLLPFAFLNAMLPAFHLPQRSRLGFVFACFAIMSISTTAQNTSGMIDGDAQQRSISGQVINAITGSPIPRSLVKLNQRAALTDHEGRFEFKNVITESQPAYQLSAEKPGFFGNNERLAVLYAQELKTMGSDPNAVITLRLYPEAIISGTVQGSDGGPLSNGSIELRKHAIVDGRRQWQNVSQARLNAEGEFRFANLQPGDYSVVAQIREQQNLTTDGQVGYLPERYPPSAAADDIVPLHLSTGQQASIELTPGAERLYAVTGYVLGSRGARGSFQVRSSNGEVRSVSPNFNPQTGSFRLLLPNGSHEISAIFYQDGGPNRIGMFGTAQVSVGERDVEGVSIVLQQTTTIPITVEMQPVAPLATTSGDGQLSSFPNLSVQLLPLSSSAFPQGMWSRQENQGGQAVLSIPNVIPGRYAVVAHAGGEWYIKSITYGASDLARDPLNIAPSAGSDPIRVVLQNDTGQVKVRMSGNEQPGIGYLYLIPAEPSATSLRTSVVSTGAAGMNTALSFTSVPPGNYFLLAYDQPHDLAYRDPEVLRQLSSIGKSVTVPGNGEVDVDVELLHADAGNQ